MTTEEKNYRRLVNKAEMAFTENRYLEAFLIQSCIIESAIKRFSSIFLKPLFESHPDLKRKAENFESARLIDELFIVGKINGELYENLSKYRKKRNAVIHGILKFGDFNSFEKELKVAFKSGRDMKGFIVDEMIKAKKGKTVSELTAKMEHDLKMNMSEIHKTQKPFFRKMNKEINKLIKKV